MTLRLIKPHPAILEEERLSGCGALVPYDDKEARHDSMFKSIVPTDFFERRQRSFNHMCVDNDELAKGMAELYQKVFSCSCTEENKEEDEQDELFVFKKQNDNLVGKEMIVDTNGVWIERDENEEKEADDGSESTNGSRLAFTDLKEYRAIVNSYLKEMDNVSPRVAGMIFLARNG